MTTWFNETFTDTTGTLLTAHTSDSGATWTSVIGATSPQLFSNLGGVVGGPSGICLYRASTISPAADLVVTAGFYYDSTNFNNIGVGARLNTAGDRGYIAVYNASTTKWQIYRLGSGQSTTLVTESAVLTYAQTDTPSIEFQVTGSGASVTLSLNVNGATVIADTADMHAERATDAGYVGVWSNRGTADSGMFVGSLSAADVAASDTMTITGPAAGKIAPLSSGTTGTATFSLTGTYTGAAPNQWRLVEDGDTVSVAGFDWASFSVAPSAGAFSQTITSVPKLNGWYNIQVRDSATPGTVYTSGKVGAGVLVGVDGQSNAWLWFSSDARGGDSTLTSNSLVRVTGKQASDSWNVPATATMNAAIACGNALATALQCPVGLVDGSFDGSGLTVTGNGGQWVPTSDDAYQDSLSAMNAAGGSLIANVWIQGEADAGQSVTQANYYAGLGTLISQRRTDLSQAALPYVVATLARDLTGTQTDAQREAIKLAQLQKFGDANIYRVERMDLPLGADNIHHSPTGFTTLGQRCAQAILAATGEAAQYRGPSFASVSQVDSTTFDVNLTHHRGSDFTPTTGITGFRVTDPGADNAAITVSSAVRHAANKIRLTLESEPVSLPDVSYLYGAAPTIAGVVLDNSTLSLPLEYNAGVTANVEVVSIGGDSLIMARRRGRR